MEDVWFEILNKVKLIDQEVDNSHVFLDDRRVLTKIRLQPPPPDTLKINVDGVHNVSSGISACGGIIRDSSG